MSPAKAAQYMENSDHFLLIVLYSFVWFSSCLSWLLGPEDTSRNPEIVKMGIWVSPISKSKSYKTKVDKNSSPGLLNLLLQHLSHKDNSKNTKSQLNSFALFLGPLRQATGPPRSGAGVGIGIWRDTIIFLGIPKIRKQYLPKIPRFHADPK